jgi:hypothetical protein
LSEGKPFGLVEWVNRIKKEAGNISVDTVSGIRGSD